MRLFTDKSEDAYPEYNGSSLLEDRNASDDIDNINFKAQSLTIKFEFLLMKAIQELHDEIKILKERINI